MLFCKGDQARVQGCFKVTWLRSFQGCEVKVNLIWRSRVKVIQRSQDQGKQISGKQLYSFDTSYNKFVPFCLTHKASLFLTGSTGKSGIFKKTKFHIREFQHDGKILKEALISEMPSGLGIHHRFRQTPDICLVLPVR